MLPAPRGWRHAWQRFVGALTWQGVGLIGIVCLLNAMRRMMPPISTLPAAEWLWQLAARFGTSLVAAFPVVLAVAITLNRVSMRPWRRYPALATAVLLSSAAGAAMMLAVEYWAIGSVALPLGEPIDTAIEFAKIYWLRYGLLAALFTAIYVYGRVAQESAARARQAELDRERLDEQMDEARLQLLEAQIEPHFLFNTLATVRRLYHSAPQAADAMLDNLVRYLGIAIPQMRVRESTLAREVDLAEAYLDIHKLRMGRRLDFEIDVPAELRDVPMPPMMLITLVENAIKHGLNPLREGGFIRIAVSAHDDAVRVRVSDSGRGFVETKGAGTGLANIRARLAASYGRRARLDLDTNEPRGITATITLPLAASMRKAVAA